MSHNNGNTEPAGTTPGMSESPSATSDLGSFVDSNLTPEEREALRAEWQGELNQLEDEMQTLRQVLNAKTKRSQELKRKLGLTVWGEITQDVNQGIKNVRDSTAVHKIEESISSVTTAVTNTPLYQKTESAIKTTAEKTSSLFGEIGSAVSQKIGALKNTDTFKSMEEKVSSAVTTVTGKGGPSDVSSPTKSDEKQ